VSLRVSLFLFCFVETRSHSAAQAGLQLTTLLPQSTEITDMCLAEDVFIHRKVLHLL
jgi:hypothetical protein